MHHRAGLIYLFAHATTIRAYSGAHFRRHQFNAIAIAWAPVNIQRPGRPLVAIYAHPPAPALPSPPAPARPPGPPGGRALAVATHRPPGHLGCQRIGPLIAARQTSQPYAGSTPPYLLYYLFFTARSSCCRSCCFAGWLLLFIDFAITARRRHHLSLIVRSPEPLGSRSAADRPSDQPPPTPSRHRHRPPPASSPSHQPTVAWPIVAHHPSSHYRHHRTTSRCAQRARPPIYCTTLSTACRRAAALRCSSWLSCANICTTAVIVTICALFAVVINIHRHLHTITIAITDRAVPSPIPPITPSPSPSTYALHTVVIAPAIIAHQSSPLLLGNKSSQLFNSYPLTSSPCCAARRRNRHYLHQAILFICTPLSSHRIYCRLPPPSPPSSSRSSRTRRRHHHRPPPGTRRHVTAQLQLRSSAIRHQPSSSDQSSLILSPIHSHHRHHLVQSNQSTIITSSTLTINQIRPHS